MTEGACNLLFGALLLSGASGIAAVEAAGVQSDLRSAPVQLKRKAATKLLLSQPKPDYPALARLNYIQGRVEVEVSVTREGRVSRVHVLRGHPFLAASALETIRRWIYRPFITRSGPSPFSTDVNVRFTLEHVDLQHIPPQAESDLERQVKPPQVLHQPDLAAGAEPVRLRVLVDDQGEVIDSTPLAGPPALFDAARQSVEGWRFRPARCGNLAVPWYLEVEVPVAAAAHSPTAPASAAVPHRQ
ncbi:MAG TPA: TonB family protein [Terriglobia bacterium]|nr:TonB family protein [Terriglobia bacterium]